MISFILRLLGWDQTSIEHLECRLGLHRWSEWERDDFSMTKSRHCEHFWCSAAESIDNLPQW